MHLDAVAQGERAVLTRHLITGLWPRQNPYMQRQYQTMTPVAKCLLSNNGWRSRSGVEAT